MTGPLEARLEALNDQAALVSAVKGQLACLSSQLDVIGRQRFGGARLSPAAVHALVEISDGLAELLDLATQAAAELVELDVSLFRVGGDVPVSRDGEGRASASPSVDRPADGDADQTSPSAQSVAAVILDEMARQQRSQIELAGALGLSQAAVSRRLSGSTPWTVDELIVAAGFLEVPVGSFMGRGVA